MSGASWMGLVIMINMQVYVVAYPPQTNSTIMHIKTEIDVFAVHPILQGQKNSKTFAVQHSYS